MRRRGDNRALRTTRASAWSLAACAAALAFTFSAAGCKKSAPPPAEKPANAAPTGAAPGAEMSQPAAEKTIRVVVTNKGEITLDGKTITLEQLQAMLTAPAGRPTLIYYQRIEPESDPTPEAVPIVRGVLTAILDSKIPTRMAR